VTVPKDEHGLNEIINKAKTAPPKEDKGDADVTITLWANGFQVDEEPFRDYVAPENKKFMEEVKSGYVPTELA
jgi:hypothetical protein